MAVIKPSFAKLWLTLHQKQKVIIIMRKKSFILLLLFISNTSLFSQNPLTEDALLEKQIYETGLIHAPLPLNTSRSFEENALKKEVLSSQPLTETEGADGGLIPEPEKCLSQKRKPHRAKGASVYLFLLIPEKEPLVLLPILTMQLMEIAVSPITSMVGTGKNTTESTFPSILIATAHA